MLVWCDVFRPFRKYDLKQGGKSWDSVDRLDKGCIYQEVWLLFTNVQHFDFPLQCFDTVGLVIGKASGL